jgi:hypothetical protein
MPTPAKTLTLKTVLANEANIWQLELGEFEAVELPAFEALSQRKHYLNLSGVQKLSDEEAAVFGKHPGILDLSGLKELSDIAITQLAAKKGGLWLNGLTTLSETAVDALSKHEGDLYLWGVKKLSDNAAKALKKTNVFLGQPGKE